MYGGSEMEQNSAGRGVEKGALIELVGEVPTSVEPKELHKDFACGKFFQCPSLF